MQIKKFGDTNPDVNDFLNYLKDFGFNCDVEKSKMYVYDPERKLVDSYTINMRFITTENKINKIEILEMIEEFEDRMLDFGFSVAAQNVRFNETTKKAVGGPDTWVVDINSSYFRLSRKVRKSL